MPEYTDLVSVIVPVFNVEKYIHKCVDSILTQNYKNIEIILVDDGSTDSSPSICDNYSSIEKNITVIHQKNEGQSSARNNGVKVANGRYITFVDSDDYIEENYIEQLYITLRDCNSDISACKMYCENESGKIYNSELKETGEVTLFSKIEALKEICYEVRFGSSPCCKLFKADLIRTCPFPVGKKYEDFATIYKIIGEADNVSYIDKCLYHYIKHSGSTVHNGWSEYSFDLIEAADSFYSYYEQNYPSLINDAVSRYFFSVNEFFTLAEQSKEFSKIVLPIKKKIKPLWKTVITNKRVSVVKKMKYTLLIVSPKMHKLMYKVYNLKIKDK